MALDQHHAWLPPGHLRPPDEHYDAAPSFNGLLKGPSRPRTPQIRGIVAGDGSQAGIVTSESEPPADEDPRIAVFRERYQRTEAKISALFSGIDASDKGHVATEPPETLPADSGGHDTGSQATAPSRPPARKIDDDDYDDYDDSEDAELASAPLPPPPSMSLLLASKPSTILSEVSAMSSPPQKLSAISMTPSQTPKDMKKESLEEIRKKLEEDKKASEEAVRRSFHTMFYTLENDRDAMLDQQRLEESERQVEAEMSGQGVTVATSGSLQAPGYGTLSSANLGASSLTLKNLIARIDMKRNLVQASDAELRSLMSEVRKNRSKWANEHKIGQEELYEAAEKVLNELKAMTEHSSAFLTRVNKRDAPDYHNVIKRPMDLGTMTKKLKAVQYKSKHEFVDDLNLIWANCLKYNANPDHFLRKHALYMRKETEKLVPLIPDVVIRDRAEVEAEERRLQLAELDGGEESDDEPIMSSRGRKAPKKGTGGGRKAPAGSAQETTAAPDARPLSSGPVRNESDAVDGSQTGLSTPPPGTLTPVGSNGVGIGATGSLDDGMDIDGFVSSVPAYGSALSGLAVDYEDSEHKIWKQVTKKDRAIVAAERHRLFNGDKLNSDGPALLRTKAGMRRWLRNQRQAADEGEAPDATGPQSKDVEPSGETLAEGIEEEEDKMLPDYYDTMSGIPDLSERLHWMEDAEGNVVETSEEFLRLLPKGLFTAPDSKFSRRMDANLRQMQDTRKICSKIGIVKQMQLQSQLYQNQFQKYEPEPFVEQDVQTHVMNDAGPVISPWVCKAALQRSVGKIFYHTGFEEFQPAALDAVTDLASEFICNITQTFKSYLEAPKVPATEDESSEAPSKWKSPYNMEEMVLHTLQSVGTDVETLESYASEDVERLGGKLNVIHERLKSHLAELLRPALADGGEDGSGAFNDGSEQFLGGDFAEDIDEDFFGFKELGLDKEFGLSTMSVPLHLLQNRMYSAHQAQNTSSSQAVSSLFETPQPYSRISMENVHSQIGLVQNFFLAKLHANKDEPLVEDLELPPKQRPHANRPRVPASGKIPQQLINGSVTVTPQKRPPTASTSITPATTKTVTFEPANKKMKKNNGMAAVVKQNYPTNPTPKPNTIQNSHTSSTSTPPADDFQVKHQMNVPSTPSIAC